MALLTFDIEISNVFELRPGEDLDRYAPFDISVAATKVVGGEERLWLSKSASGVPTTNLERSHARELLGYLEAMQREGHMLVAWNGLSFDLRWIGHAAGDMAAARRVALKLYDPMFQFFKLKGFPVGLAKVGEGMGIRATKLMDGADAPKQWRAGNHKAVCDYVMGDVRLTADVANAISQARAISWITMRGTPSSVSVQRLRTVEECMRDPMPDQSWMSAPLREEKFTGWLRA
jgi:hypothetical protein